MKRLALVSIGGGSGRSTLSALLATLSARQGRWSLLLEWDPRNVLSWYLGARHGGREGLARSALDGQAWQSACLRADDGTLLLPFGTLTPSEEAGLAWHMAEDTQWLAKRLDVLDVPASGVVFIDTPTGPCVYQRQAVQAADAVVLVMRPDMVSTLLLDQALALAGDRPVAVVVNGLDIARPSQNEAWRRLRATLGERLIPYPVHRDEVVPQAFALNLALPDHAPQSQAMHDLHGVLAWLQRWQETTRGGTHVA
jgi:cellulose synthase operon protein YhjQ